MHEQVVFAASERIGLAVDAHIARGRVDDELAEREHGRKTPATAPPAPAAVATWSQLDPAPSTIVATYRSFESGGCTNTNSERTASGIVQRTNATRSTAAWSTLRLWQSVSSAARADDR